MYINIVSISEGTPYNQYNYYGVCMQDNNGKKTTLSVSKETRKALSSLGFKDEDYDTIINNCMKFKQKFDNEQGFCNWFKENYCLFGFDKIVKENKRSFPDFILMKKGKEIRVEIETLSSNFIRHNHNPVEVDMVICLLNDMELTVPTLEITPFEYESIRTTINITKSTLLKIYQCGYCGESTDRVVSRVCSKAIEEKKQQGELIRPEKLY